MLACWILALGCVEIAEAAGRNPRQSVRDVKYLVPPPVREPEAMGQWLLRLVDDYRVDGMGDIMLAGLVPVKGRVDCAAIGSGAGLHCIFYIHWVDQYQISMDEGAGAFNVPGGVSYLNPSMMLVGLVPNEGALQFLLVDNKGLPEGGLATIAGNRATLRSPCVNAPTLFNAMSPGILINYRRPESCERITRIDARPGSSVVHLTIEIEINGERVTQFLMTLRRGKKRAGD